MGDLTIINGRDEKKGGNMNMTEAMTMVIIETDTNPSLEAEAEVGDFILEGVTVSIAQNPMEDLRVRMTKNGGKIMKNMILPIGLWVAKQVPDPKRVEGIH